MRSSGDKNTQTAIWYASHKHTHTSGMIDSRSLCPLHVVSQCVCEKQGDRQWEILLAPKEHTQPLTPNNTHFLSSLPTVCLSLSYCSFLTICTVSFVTSFYPLLLPPVSLSVYFSLSPSSFVHALIVVACYAENISKNNLLSSHFQNKTVCRKVNICTVNVVRHCCRQMLQLQTALCRQHLWNTITDPSLSPAPDADHTLIIT